MPVVLVWMLTVTGLPPAAVQAGALPRSETAGLALVLEAWRYGGGYGAAAVYYQPVPVGPTALWAQLGAGISGDLPRAVVPGASVGVSVGRQHRVVAALGWGAIARSVLSLHGTRVAERTIYGPDAGAGYEYLSEAGLLFRVLAGAVYLPRSWQESTDRLRPTITLAFGWKFW